MNAIGPLTPKPAGRTPHRNLRHWVANSPTFRGRIELASQFGHLKLELFDFKRCFASGPAVTAPGENDGEESADCGNDQSQDWGKHQNFDATGLGSPRPRAGR